MAASGCCGRKKQCGWKMPFDQISRCYRRPLQTPPRPCWNCSRQVVLSSLFQVSDARAVRPLQRRLSPAPTLPTRSKPASASAGRLKSVSLVRPHEVRRPQVREIQTQFFVSHVAMSHDPTIAWKASPTRTPPPICTSAPFLKPRWSQDRGRREQLKKYTKRDF